MKDIFRKIKRDTKCVLLAAALLLTAVPALTGCGREAEEEGLTIQEEPKGAKAGDESGSGDTEVSEDGQSALDETVQDGTVQEEQVQDDTQEKSADNGQKENNTTSLYVDVCGAVNRPGVYELQEDARVYEAIASAGGLTENAAPQALNQARVLTDGEQVYVPTKEELEAGLAAGAAQGASKSLGEAGTEGDQGTKVNINTASREELMTLTGIGESKADSIIAYREENGGFKSPEDLMQITGIKEGVYNKIKDDITV